MNLQAFLDDFMQKDDLNLLTRDVYELFGCPVMVVDMAFRAISWHRPRNFVDPPFQSTIDRGSLTYETSTFLVGSDGEAAPAAHYVTLEDSLYQRRFSPLINAGVPVGYLILVDVRDALRDVAPEVFSAVESALAKQLVLETSRGSQVLNTEEAVLLHLLEGKFADPQLFELQAATAGLRQFAPRRFALVNLELYRGTSWTENALRNAILDLFPRSRPLLHRGSVLFFLNSEPDLHLFRELARRFSLRIIISAPLERLFDLPRACAATHEIMDCLLPHLAQPFALRAEGCHALMLLRQLAPRGDLVLPQVRALARQDAADQTLYCQTLYAYLCCHRSLQETSARLYAHRNTVLYRVRRMREDFDVPLDDPDQHLALLLSAALVLLEQGREDLFLPLEAADAN